MIGETLALFSAFAFALGSVAMAKGAQRSRGESCVLLSVWMTGGLAALAWGIAGHRTYALDSPSVLWPALGWFAASGVLATVWGRLTLFSAIRYAGVIRAQTVRRLMPFLSVVLAWLLLDETITLVAIIGMTVLAASFAILFIDSRHKLDTSGTPASTLDLPRGYAFGIICAFSYAASFIVRKYGLDAVPNPYLGALISSLAALAYYVAGYPLSATYRDVVRSSLTNPDPWHLLAAFSISVGQISQFVALTYTGVSRVAIINSVEIFISAYLAVAIFKTESRPSPLLLLAAALATAGVIIVATG